MGTNDKTSFCSIARQNLDGNNYFILLILTDGVITDMPQTSEAIVQVRFGSSAVWCWMELDLEVTGNLMPAVCVCVWGGGD